jgi:inner membrane protein
MMFWFILFATGTFALYFWYHYRVQQREQQSSSAPHRSGQRYIGQVLTLEEGLREGANRITLGNRRWQLRGVDVPPGGKVRVIGVDGSVLLVDRLPG